MERLEKKQTSSSFQVAQFYDKQKKYRAAAIYYNEVIRQQPGSKESEEAKKRIDQLRAKLGDTALQPAYVAAEEAKKKEAEKNKRQGAGGTTPTPASERTPTEPASSNSAASPEPARSTVDRPVSPPASDLVQPPRSLLPDRNPFDTAPESSATPESSPTP